MVLVLVTFMAAVSAQLASPLTMAPRIRTKDSTSTNWSGYAVETNLQSTQSGIMSDVKGDWKVPAVTGTTTTYSSFWIGIDGYSSNSVEQIGTDSDLSSGKQMYYAWYEMYPKGSMNINMAISPGDSMSAEVKHLGNGNFKLTLTDITAGSTFTTTQKSQKAQRSSAEWIAEAPWSGGVLPLANFGSVTFTGCSATLNVVTGTINNTAWQKDAMTMATSSGIVKASPNGLTSDGTSFVVQWSHS